ncbi:hypothetical protein ACVWXN_010847 [Bradyrhizobium sp. i1.4.4]
MELQGLSGLSFALTTSPKGGQFVLHAKALHGNPFDGHTLGPVIADMEKLTGVETRQTVPARNTA